MPERLSYGESGRLGATVFHDDLRSGRAQSRRGPHFSVNKGPEGWLGPEESPETPGLG